MSDTRRDAGPFDKLRVGPSDVEGRGAKFDEAIDRAVREMLDVEPPAGLRVRVLDRIDERRSGGWSWGWVAAPLAAAAILVLAVLMPSESSRPIVAPPPTRASDVHLAPPAPRAPQPRPPIVVARSGVRPPRAQQSVAAAMVPADPAVEGAQVEALAGPESIAIDRLAGPPRPSVSELAVAPIQIRALEVNPLTETPRERREE